MTIGEKIKAKRLEKGLTQKRLGELSGIAEPTIRRYESGKLNPKLDTIKKIAEGLGITPTLFRLTLNKAEKCFFSAEYVANLNIFSAIFSVK